MKIDPTYFGGRNATDVMDSLHKLVNAKGPELLRNASAGISKSRKYWKVPDNVRKRMLLSYRNGRSANQIANDEGVHASTTIRIIKEMLKNETV